MSYTREQIERVAVAVFSAVTDTSDAGSQARMKTITRLFGGMLANEQQTIDERTLDESTQLLLSHYLRGETGVRGPFMP